jgi:hypothetical protein
MWVAPVPLHSISHVRAAHPAKLSATSTGQCRTSSEPAPATTLPRNASPDDGVDRVRPAIPVCAGLPRIAGHPPPAHRPARVWPKVTAGLIGVSAACPSEKALRDLRRRRATPAPSRNGIQYHPSVLEHRAPWTGLTNSVIRRDTIRRWPSASTSGAMKGSPTRDATKVGLDEVDQALHAPLGLRFERHIGDLLLVVMGMADTGRVIAVLCDRVERTTTYRIISVRPRTGPELDQWRTRVL